jgi:indolepyruvate ferredoxin oxidoreductase alpha subunit
MGHSNGTGGGLTLMNDKRKVLTLLGDSTLFHAGIPAIINAVLYDYDMTLVIMENGTTAMTGHQPHAASGEIGDKIPIKPMLEGLGVKWIREVGAYKQKELTALVNESFRYKGFSIIIAKHPCMLKFTRKQKRAGKFNPKQVEIDQETCNQSYECLKEFACPSFEIQDDGKVKVQKDLCIGDGSCKQTCPADSLVQPERKK